MSLVWGLSPFWHPASQRSWFAKLLAWVIALLWVLASSFLRCRWGLRAWGLWRSEPPVQWTASTPCISTSLVKRHLYYWPANGPVLFCSLASVVVCNADGVQAARPPGAWAVGRPTLHGGPVRLRPVRATPCSARRAADRMWWCAVVELLELSKVVAELERATLTSYNNRQLTVSELVSHLTSLLTTVNDSSAGQPLDIQLYADLILNWLLNVYDQWATAADSLPLRTAWTGLSSRQAGHVPVVPQGQEDPKGPK